MGSILHCSKQVTTIVTSDNWLNTLQFEDVRYPGAADGSSVGCGLVQPKNGPCGLIAAIQAACIAELI